MNRDYYLNIIRERFIDFQKLVTLSNNHGYFDVNRSAENVVRDLLNVAYDYSLINLNQTRANFPGIDLADSATGICFQVTSSKEVGKLKTKINSYLRNIDASKYPHYHIFLIAGKRATSYDNIQVESFTVPANRIWDFDDLYKQIENLDNEKVKQLAEITNVYHIRFEALEKAEKQYLDALSIRFSAINDPFGTHYISARIIETQTYIPPKRRLRNSDLDHFSITSLRIAVNEKRRLLLTGGPGSGKSSALSNLITELCKPSEGEKLIPIYINLSDYKVPVSIDEAIYHEILRYVLPQLTYDKTELAKDLCSWWINSGSVCLLIDGYDEISAADQKQWQSLLQQFYGQQGSAKLVVALRHSSIPRQILFPVASTYAILPFTKKQALELVEHYLLTHSEGTTEANRTKLAHRILNLLDRANWDVTPMLILMVARLVTENVLGESIDQLSQSAIYKHYFEYLFKFAFIKMNIPNPHEEFGSTYTKLVEEGFKAISEMAGETWIGQQIKEPDQSFASFNTLLSKVLVLCKRNEHLTILNGPAFFIRQVPLLRSFSQDGTASFVHPTWMEFLVAYKLSIKLKSNSKATWKWIRSAYAYSKYHQTFIFVTGLLNQAENLIFINKFKRWRLKHIIFKFHSYDKLLQGKNLFLAELVAENRIPSRIFQKELDSVASLISVRNNYHFNRAAKAMQRIYPESEVLFDKIVNTFLSNSTWNKKATLIHCFQKSLLSSNHFIPKIKGLLDHDSSYIRGAALEALASVECHDADVIDRAISLAFEKESFNGIEATSYLREVSKTQPDKMIPFAEKFKIQFRKAELSDERRDLLATFADVFLAVILRVPGYDQFHSIAHLVSNLKNTSLPIEDRMLLFRNVTKAGIQNSEVIEAALGLLDEDSPMRFRSLMYFRDLGIVNQEVADKAIQWLDHPDPDTKIRSINYLEAIRYDAIIEMDGKQVKLADRVRKMVELETIGESSTTYAIDYLGKIGYTSDSLTQILMEHLKNPDKNKKLGDRDTILRYFIRVKHFSKDFFEIILSKQRLKGGLEMSSFISNDYVNEIDLYLTGENHAQIRDSLFDLTIFNLKAFRILTKRIDQTQVDDMWANEQIEKMYRTVNALIKTALWVEEKKYREQLFSN